MKSPSTLLEGLFTISICCQFLVASPAFDASFATVVAPEPVVIADLIGTQGCTGAVCPGRTGGPAFRICPAGHGLSSWVGRRSAGGGGASSSASLVLAFAPGHWYGAFRTVPYPITGKRDGSVNVRSIITYADSGFLPSRFLSEASCSVCSPMVTVSVLFRNAFFCSTAPGNGSFETTATPIPGAYR